jgi:hypothetical protein
LAFYEVADLGFSRSRLTLPPPNFDTYTEALQEIVITDQVAKLLSELELARACGFAFRVGVRREAHKEALEDADPRLRGLIEVMDWC